MITEGLLAPLRRRRLSVPQPRRHLSMPGPGRRLSMPRPRPRLIAILVGVVLVLGGAWLWLRDSSLVSVDHVVVSGESGPDATQIRSALIVAARNMTTLDVRMDQLRTAVAPYPVVRDLRVSTQFPHGMRIRVIEQIPVGAVLAGGRTFAVAGDGTLLHDVPATVSLPAIPLKVPPGGDRLTDPDALHAVALLAAAPYAMLGRVSQVTTVTRHGLVAQLRSGPSVYFGDADRLAAKWTAVIAVLADPGSAGAVYLDVTDPGRPAAGAATTAANTAAGATGGAGATSRTSSTAVSGG